MSYDESTTPASTTPYETNAVAIARPRFSVVSILIFTNVLVYALWVYAGTFVDPAAADLGGSRFGFFDYRWMAENFLVSWDSLAEGRIWTLITSEFSHNALLHIMMNMLVLRSFGFIVEWTLGRVRFLTFYFIAAIVSSLAHAAVSNFIIGDPTIPALGASGAISGIVLLFSLLYPREKILLFAIIPVPAVLGAVLFVALDIWGLVAQAEGGGLPIGHGAHLGGALTGLIYYLWLRAAFKPTSAARFP